MKHGVRASYVHGCRCVDCTRANREYMQIWKADHDQMDPPEHGTAASYSNYRCRCDECTTAQATKQRADYARRREKQAR